METKSRILLPLDGVFFWPIFAVLIADQLSKFVIVNNLYIGESIPREGLLRITYVMNSGSAFSVFSGHPAFFVFASVVAISVLLLFYSYQSTSGPWLKISLGLQMGGAIGNLIDRIRFGAVVDFIDFGWWPVFNLADSFIVVGLSILIFILLFHRPKNERHSESVDEDRL
mgnify:CR=1 FL=1